MTRERTGDMPSYAEAKKMKSLTPDSFMTELTGYDVLL